jgi:hypothetical protein
MVLAINKGAAVSDLYLEYSKVYVIPQAVYVLKGIPARS